MVESDKRKVIIKDFLDLLEAEIEDCTRKCDLNAEIQKYHNILIILSAGTAMAQELIKSILDIKSDIKINVLGSNWDRDILEEFLEQNEEFEYQIYMYDGRFSVERIRDYKKIIELDNENLDAIFFFCDVEHSQRYCNVEMSAEELAINMKLPIYGYTSVKELFYFSNIDNHYKSINLYAKIATWFHD